MNPVIAQPRVAGVDAALQSLHTMTSHVENSVRQALFALRETKADEASQVFLREARINEMEVEIDEQVVRLLARCRVEESELRLLIATLRVTNDLERLGDLALNMAGCVVSLEESKPIAIPRDLKLMTNAAEQMVVDSLRALHHRRPELAQQVLESDDRVDGYAESLQRTLTDDMGRDSGSVPGKVQLLLATRTLERMADHATNIAEDVIFWLHGLDVRHHMRRSQP
jgi:phosphate transport system protein